MLALQSPAPDPGWPSWRATALAAAIFTALTLASTWPWITHLSILDPGDSSFFAWEIGWIFHALRTDPLSLPHANFFHPLRYTLGMDEPILGTAVLVAPLALFTHDAVFLFNVARLLTYLLSALSAWLLARSLGCGEGPSLLAGAAFAFSPIRTDQIAHLSTLGTQWLPLVVLFMVRFFRLGRTRDALLAGLLFVLETLACGYHGLIAVAILPLAALPLLWRRLSRLPGAALALGVAGVGLLPLFLLHRAALAPLQYVRRVDETVSFSAALESFLATSSWNLLYGELSAPFRTTYANNLFPGLLLPLLAAVALVAAWRQSRLRDRELLSLLALVVGAVLVALGPEIRLFGERLCEGPFGLLRRSIPLFQMIRVPSRSGAFLALGLAVLAARGLQALALRRSALALVGSLMLLETVIAPIPFPAWSQVVDSRQPPPPVYDWLARQPGAPVVVELPLLDIGTAFTAPAYHESIYLLRSTWHWKPLANGYAGIEPPSYVELRARARAFPSAEALEAFRRHGVRYVILHQRGYGPNRWARIRRELPAFASELREIVRFPGDTVFELDPD